MAEDRKLKTGMTAQKKQAVIEQLWLTYFNDTLYAKGLITEEQRNAMRLTIRSRTAAQNAMSCRAAIAMRSRRPLLLRLKRSLNRDILYVKMIIRTL